MSKVTHIFKELQIHFLPRNKEKGLWNTSNTLFQLVCLWLVWSEKNRTISSTVISLISKSSIWERNNTWKNYLFSLRWIFVSFSLQFHEQFLKIVSAVEELFHHALVQKCTSLQQSFWGTVPADSLSPHSTVLGSGGQYNTHLCFALCGSPVLTKSAGNQQSIYVIQRISKQCVSRFMLLFLDTEPHTSMIFTTLYWSNIERFVDFHKLQYVQPAIFKSRSRSSPICQMPLCLLYPFLTTISKLTISSVINRLLTQYIWDLFKQKK